MVAVIKQAMQSTMHPRKIDARRMKLEERETWGKMAPLFDKLQYHLAKAFRNSLLRRRRAEGLLIDRSNDDRVLGANRAAARSGLSLIHI